MVGFPQTRRFEMDVPSLTVDLSAVAFTIPGWVLMLIPVLAGVVCMSLAGRNEAKGIQGLSPGPNGPPGSNGPELERESQRRFRRMGMWRVLAYVSALLFLWLAR